MVPSPINPIRSQGDTLQCTHPHPISVNPGTTTEHYTPGPQERQTQTASQSRENTHTPITPHPSRYKTQYRSGTQYLQCHISRWTTTNPLSVHGGGGSPTHPLIRQPSRYNTQYRPGPFTNNPISQFWLSQPLTRPMESAPQPTPPLPNPL